MYTNLKEATKVLQGIAGVTADGIYGINTANALITKLAPTPQPATPPIPGEIITGKEWGGLITTAVHNKCAACVNVFETGSITGNYSDVSIYKDGGGGKYYQVTFGKAGSTQDGTLDTLLSKYVAAAFEHIPSATAKVIKDYLPVKNKRDLYEDTTFKNALKAAGKETLMQVTQDEFFDEVYFAPAHKWFKQEGFTLPLSMLVIYDSFIHSGSILPFLRKRFAAVPPSKGGDEKEWIKTYVTTRRSWLANHSNKILRNTVYRMDTMNRAFKDDNWMLTGKIYAHGTTIA